MKKIINYVNKIIKFSSLGFLALLAFSACEIGLGEAVDLKAPVVELTSHKDNDSVAQTFRLAGTAHDNEEVTKLSVDFEEADIHFKVEPGKKWKKKTSGSDWESVPEDKAGCTYENGEWHWFVDVNAAEAKSGMGSNYSLEIIVSDAMGNSGKESKINCSLIVDEKIPNVSIYKPDIVSSFKTVKDTFDSYDPDPAKGITGNNFLNLINGEITLYGRQEGAASFRELRIELDDGTTDGSVISDNVPVIKNPTTEAIATEYPIGNCNNYYSRTLVRGTDAADLRNWQLTIAPEEWVNSAHPELATGKHIIRIVSTSISNSDAWERKVIGYFIWWPEADKPWIESNNGGLSDTAVSEIFPSASVSGIAYDDDGIESLVYTIKKQKTDDNNNISYEVFQNKENLRLALSEEKAKTSAWSLNAPDEEGIYELTLTITDIYGTTANLVRYYKTMDVIAPDISVEVNPSALANKNGDIDFKGSVSDDGRIESLKVIFLNPAHNNTPANMIRYLGGTEAFWNNTSTETDSYGNRIFIINPNFDKYDNITKKNLYTFSKTLNLFNKQELNIGLDADQNQLGTLNFVFRVKDNGGTTTIYQTSVNGDTESPELAITSIQQFNSINENKTEKLTGEVPNLAVVATGDYVILEGTWSDNSVKKWENKNKISPISFTWGSANFETPEYTKNPDGSYNWTCKVTDIPTSSATITASIKDYGNNETTVTKTVFIETMTISLERVGAFTSDGKYKAGTTIRLSLEFTKATHVDGNPTLSLNLGPKKNRKKATFVSSSNDSAQLEFDYTVQSGDTVTNLDVEAINGGTWRDSAVIGDTFTPALPTEDTKKLGTSRSISIDTTPPVISGITVLSPANSYKVGTDQKPNTILLRLSFSDAGSEGVKIKNAGNLSLGFKGITSPDISAKKSGSDILITYTIGASDNANPLKFKENSLSHSDVVVEDDAGNELTEWNLAEKEFTDIIIDNENPLAPNITPAWTESEDGSDVIVTADTSFDITGEAEATIEYSLDNGTNWTTYSNTKTSRTRTIELKNNGVYKILARQTDKAGNGPGPVSAAKTVTVEKTEIFKNVTVTDPEATYKTGDTITGQINFGKEVKLPSGSTITLNVKRNNAALPAITINNPTEKASSFTFTYTVAEKDVIDTTNNSNGYLKVTNWSFNTVEVDYGTAGSPNVKNYSLPYSSELISGNNIQDSKHIKISAGYPKYQNYNLSEDNQTLTITFDRNISKVSGTKQIKLEMEDDYLAPAVLTESQYNNLPASIKNAKFTNNAGKEKYYYAEGVNGANKPSEEATTLTPDTTKKYILDYDIDDDDTDLRDLFTAANKDKVIIPLYSSNITASGTVLTVKLTGSYAIPVKGATYKLTIPSGIVQDDANNQNNETNGSRVINNIVANDIEPPVIRIQKRDQTITSTGSANTATVTMPDTAKMKITCQTPDAELTWEKNEKNQNSTNANSTRKIITIADAKTHSKSDLTTEDAKIPTTGFTTYSSEQTLGSAISNYTGATGLKIAIVATASKNGKTKTSYEYAARTVLRLDLDTRYYDRGGGYANAATSEGTKALCDLPVWVQGGDSPAGGNTIAGYPLSWDDCSTFKLMACDTKYRTHTFNGNNWSSTSNETTAANGKTAFSEDGSWRDERTYWYWVTWDLSSVCYTGFAVGDVPADASTSEGANGPKNWYVGECSWNAIKTNTALYPGETLILSLHEVDNTDDNNNTKGAYLFRTKNHGSR